MSDFNILKLAVQKQFKTMESSTLFVVDIDKEKLWNTYLDSFPEGTNAIYKERREYDCNCCKQFVRILGHVVAIVDNKLVSIWDMETEEPFNTVCKALSKLVKSKAVTDVFYHYQSSVGSNKTPQLLEGGGVISWDHFQVTLPKAFVKPEDSIATLLGELRSSKEVFKRALEEISLESAQIVTDLIDQNSLYRGEEHKGLVTLFIKHKKIYDKLAKKDKDNYTWLQSVALGSGAKLRNTVIGTLLVDLSNGVELDSAVKSFEQKVAPSNYKRPTALVTKAMVKNAQDKVQELGIEASLDRRYAVTEDITINNVIFADRSIKKQMNVFDELIDNTKINRKQLDKVEEVSIETFINDIVPKSKGISLLLENKHEGNLMSLIAPVYKDAKNIFKWDNNFSWSYKGDVADSIKARVKAAGGNVDGVLRCSLSWYNLDDLDIHVIEPSGNRIFFGSKSNSSTSGVLDVDMNAYGPKSETPVENITWSNKAKMQEGDYQVIVHNFCKRASNNVGFVVELECDGKVINIEQTTGLRDGIKETVATFNYSKSNGITIKKSLPTSERSNTIWGVPTATYQKVNMIMHSPNHWDGNETGNKHWFFILNGCKNEESARGFYNEFLSNELQEHRKVFEVLGSKMKTPESDNQLSGVGFSSTQRNSAYFKVSGSFERTIKVNF